MDKFQEKKIYYNLKENLLGILAAFIIIVLVTFISADESNVFKSSAFILAVIIIFVPLEIAFIIKVISKKPAVIIGADGLYVDHLCKVTIPWNHIEKISIVKASPMKFIGLFMYENKEYMSSMRLIPRLFGWYYKTPYVFSTNSMSIGNDELLLVLQNNLSEYRISNKATNLASG
jgi:hypothetical protein